MHAAKQVVRIAALGDLHHSRTAAAGSLQPLFTQISEEADILVLCGDLTDYGLPEEARSLVRELAPLKIPSVAVLGNHDFQSDQPGEVARILVDAGVKGSTPGPAGPTGSSPGSGRASD